MVRKKSRIGCRALSVFLSILMLLCTLSVAVVAADDIADVEVIERSHANLIVFRTIEESRQTDKVYAGTPVGKCKLVTSPAALRFVNDDGSFGTSYASSKLSVSWENPENVFNAGRHKDLIRIYVTNDPSIYVVLYYEFEVYPGQSIQTPEIAVMPTIDLPSSPFKYYEGIKVSDLTLNTEGAKATVNGEPVEGTFSFTDLSRALYVGENKVSVTFTPADPTQAEAVTFTIPVTVEKGDIVVKEAPTFTYVYSNRTLRDLGTVGAEIQNGVVEPSTVKWDFVGKTGLSSDASDPLAKQVLSAGTYQVTARATVSNGYFNTGFFPVNVVIKADETKAFPMQVALEGNELHIKADTTYGGYGGKGTVTYTVNDTVVAENADPTVEVVYAIPESGDYTVKAEYTPAENDNYIYKSATQTVKAILPRTVTVNGGSGSGSYKPGDTVRVEFDQASLKKYYEFKGWKITNAEGETVDVGVEDLTQTSISFTMPDEDVTVEANTSFSIQLFFKSIGDMIMNFLMKVVEWIMGLFNGLGSLS